MPIHGRAAAQSHHGELVDYRPAEGEPVTQVPRDELWSVPLEKCAPVRKALSYKGQKNFTGEWWCSTTESHISFESWVERDFLLTVDFDPYIVGISVQPFTFRFVTAAGKQREHTPDVFLRSTSGDGVVVDVRPDRLVDDDAREAFDATAELCEQAGWSYRRAGEQPRIRAANLRWLAGYRNPRNRRQDTAADLISLLTSNPMTISEAAAAVGEPILVLPTLYHLLWTHELDIDVDSAPIGERTMIGLVAR
ncbi:hypothetical protein MFAL_09200 [Mycolicibacterium fallax]|nr:hypothetical protein MFAL_09200 [Mycolicibacterium fallax]